MAPSVIDDATRAKAERKAAKKVAAAERAAERQRIAQEKALAKAAEKERIAAEKAAEKERVAAEKAAEKERLAALKAEKDKAAKDKAEKEKAEREQKAEQEKIEKEKAEKERLEREQANKERLEKEKAERERIAQAKKAEQVVKAAQSKIVTNDADSAGARKAQSSKPAEPVVHTPILSKMPRKNKPVAKPIKIPKEEQIPESASVVASAATSDAPQLPEPRTLSSSNNNSRAHSVDRTQNQLASLQDLFNEIDMQYPWMNLSKHPLFDLQKINPAAKMPLEYAPLVHALSALSVGGGSFANNMPSGSIDNAVSSFQQLLETLTQTISDLLRLLPRTTWDDSSSFDGVLRDMLKGDDFLDDGGEDNSGAAPTHTPGSGKEDEVAALTQALERRARWMEVQLSKLEELHRDINTAAVRAVLSFNDAGWDPHGFLPRVGDTLHRFDQIGEEGPIVRAMTADELEEKMHVAKEAATFVETELREVMQNLQKVKPNGDRDF